MNTLEQMVAQGAALDAGAELENQEAMGLIQPETDPNAAAMEWLIVPQMLSFVIKTIYPETAAHYTEANEMQLAKAIVPVAEKYGWNGFNGSPEIMLGMAAVGFAMPAFLAHKARKQAETKKTENAQLVEESPQHGRTE